MIDLLLDACIFVFLFIIMYSLSKIEDARIEKQKQNRIKRERTEINKLP